MIAPRRRSLVVLAALAAGAMAITPVRAEVQLLVEADSGKVLYAEKATQPWYPASVTKLMTVYTALRAVREGRLTMDTPLMVTPNAASQAPTKMGFPAGTTVTLDNAIKMVMVKSANDMAFAIAEGVGGSIDGFSDMMNLNARRLGMTQTNYVNPNGLPDERQVTSARDLAILARALIREFPEREAYWHISAIRFGKRVMRNYNTLIDRYPGADGMKTGFICSAGYNLVATATRNGKRLIAVVLGAYGGAARAQKAAQLLERGFNSGGGPSWLSPSLATVDSLVPVNAAPPDMRDQMCGKNRRRPASEDNDEDEPDQIASDGDSNTQAMMLSAIRPANAKYVLGPIVASGPTIDVYANTVKVPGQPGKARAKLGKKAKSKVAAKPNGKSEPTPAIAVPEGGDKAAAKPAEKKKAAAKPKAKPAASAKADHKADNKPTGTTTAAAKPAAQ